MGNTKAIKNVIVIRKMLFRWKKQFIYVFFISALSRFLMYETYYDQLKNYFTQDGIQIHYQDTVSLLKL